MKVCLLAALIAFGCGSKGDPGSGTGSAVELARPTVSDPIGFCQRAQIVMMGRRKCFPEDSSLKMGLEEIQDLVTSAPADPDKRRRVAASCATMLDGMMRAEQPKNCPLDVTDDERAELATFLAAWNRDRKLDAGT